MRHVVLVDANGLARIITGRFALVIEDNASYQGRTHIVDFYRNGKHDEERGTGFVMGSLREALNLIAEKDREIPRRPQRSTYACPCGYEHCDPRVFSAHRDNCEKARQ